MEIIAKQIDDNKIFLLFLYFNIVKIKILPNAATKPTNGPLADRNMHVASVPNRGKYIESSLQYLKI